MKTPLPREDAIVRKWYVVNAENQILGRLATQIAVRLRGKHKAIFTPHLDTGDYIVVVNAEKVSLTGKKLDRKLYYRHTGYLGHLKEMSARKMIAQKPEEVLRLAVRRMLPKNRLGRNQLKKLKIYAGAVHPHAAQQPEPIEIATR